MSLAPHPAIAPGRVAVVTGAASGIGLALAERFAGQGLRVALADIDPGALEAAARRVGEAAASPAHVMALLCDVGRRDDVLALEGQVRAQWGEVGVVVANAGREGGGKLLGDPARWAKILETNLWGVVHSVQAFVPGMMAQGMPGLVVATGSKQGITCPPGDTAYNVSKAGVKIVMEALAHELRQTPGCAVTAALLIPGFTFTGFTRVRVSEKPAGAWTPEQVVDRFLEGVAAGEFYILCDDNQVTRATDEKRIRWAAEDIIQNRPPLSRWHPDYKDAFEAFMRG